jgi:hypothetical protein
MSIPQRVNPNAVPAANRAGLRAGWLTIATKST